MFFKYRHEPLNKEMHFVLKLLKKQAGPCMQKKKIFIKQKESLGKLVIMIFAYHSINVYDSILVKET